MSKGTKALIVTDRNEKYERSKKINVKKVLDTTLEMIMEHGVQATSMSKVSKASGVAVGTIYHHFASKEAIITELYRHFKTEMLKVMVNASKVDGDIKTIFVKNHS